MYRVSSKSLEDQKHLRLDGVRILLFFNGKKRWSMIFMTLRLTTASTKPDFCFLSLNVKNTVQVWTMATFDYN